MCYSCIVFISIALDTNTSRILLHIVTISVIIVYINCEINVFSQRMQCMSMDRIKEKALYAYPHIFPILLFTSLEIQNTDSVFSNLPAFIASCFLLYAALSLLFAMTGKVSISGLLVSLTLSTFYVVSFYRQMQTGQVLLPQDLNLAQNISSIFAFSNIAIHWRPVCSVLCVAALNIPLFHVSKRIRLDFRKRAIIFAVSGVLMSLALFTRFSQRFILSSIDTGASISSSFNDVYKDHGALLGFYTVSVTDGVDQPENYSRAYMETLASSVAENPVEGGNGESLVPDTMPDVIVVMSEAFWDPSRLPNIGFSQEPVPNLRRLCDTSTSGNVIPPTFGGMTCNTEFEFLTGHSMKFVGYGDIPYYEEETYIDRDNGRSLVSMFRDNGYRTVALHTYTASFFGRDEIYPKLGFDEFIAEEDLPDAQIKGTLRGQEIISDEYFCDVLIDTIENSEEPLFLFGITVQNHTPYLPDKYESTRIEADSGGVLAEEDEKYIETYLEGVYDADQVLGRLHEYVMESDDPTILVYFGDHLPLLTQQMGVYTDLGYIGEGDMDELSTEDAYKMFSTPYVAFSNYSELPETWGDISPYFLGAIVAEAAGIELNLYYQFLVQSFDSFQAMNQYLFISDGDIDSAPSEEASEIVEMFEAFQYDKLFGEEYLDDFISDTP